MNVLHVPTITKNLVSVGQIVDQGMQVRFTHLGCFIEEEGKVIAQGRREGRMFILDTNQAGTALYAKGQKVESDIDLWHKRFGHVNFPRLREMQTKNIVFGLPKFRGRNGQVCEACQMGKQHRLPFPNERNRSRSPLDLIHSDVWGPAQNVSLGGSRYFVTFIDDFTRHTWVCTIAKKSEVFACFLKVKSLAERETGRKIKCLRSDGGKEYFSDQFTSYLQKEGIRREFSCRYTPEQNGVAERKNRTIEEAARAMLEEKHMPKFYWAEAVKTAVYLQNQTSANGGVSPHELYFGKKPNLAHLRIFGSIAYVHVPKEKRRKLDAKAEKCILVGYSDEQKGYKCYNPRTKEVRVSRDIMFDESAS